MDVIMMRHRTVHVREDVGTVKVEVLRLGLCQEQARVRYRTQHVSSTASDFEPIEGEVAFAPGEMVQYIQIAVNDDMDFEFMKQFHIMLLSASPSSSANLGVLSRTAVYMVDVDSYPVPTRTTSDLTDWQLLRGFWAERWRHRHPKPLKALACRCYRSLDRVLETVLLSRVVIPLLRQYAAAPLGGKQQRKCQRSGRRSGCQRHFDDGCRRFGPRHVICGQLVVLSGSTSTCAATAARAKTYATGS